MSHTLKRRSLQYRLIWRTECFIKELLFKCQGCGQCILKDNGFICPMRCPKNLRNGRCEVYPELECVWYKGIRRTERYHFLLQDRVPKAWQKAGLFLKSQERIQPPIDWRMYGTSSWVNHMGKRNDRFLSLPDKEGVEAYEWHCRNEKVDC
ncbi:MAG: methylenetetrahydrofolate reductase C-terminal domain-containing protein [Candidatus Bipolaricaulia bacterium]